MHDLNTLHRLNVEAHAKSVTQWRSAGQWVVVVYEGLTLFSATPHDTESSAKEEHAAIPQVGGTHSAILPPTAAHYAATRDQSEDRPVQYSLEELAALGATTVKPVTTVGDYITQKQQAQDTYTSSRNAA